MVSSFSGGTSVQERAVVEPEDMLANPDYDQYSNLLEYAFGTDPLSGANPFFGGPGPYEAWAEAAIRARMSEASRTAYIAANSVLENEYIRGSDWGGGVGGILYTSRAGVLSWAHYNGRGDVVTRTSDTGSLTYAASYEAFGTRTQEAGTNPDRQRANTKEEDPTGLLNEGHRYRDLELGMFISRDPAGFVDGPNVYTYVVQNPWSAFDPEGLWGRGESNGAILDNIWNFGKGVGKGVTEVGEGLGVAAYHVTAYATDENARADINQKIKAEVASLGEDLGTMAEHPGAALQGAAEGAGTALKEMRTAEGAGRMVGQGLAGAGLGGATTVTKQALVTGATSQTARAVVLSGAMSLSELAPISSRMLKNLGAFGVAIEKRIGNFAARSGLNSRRYDRPEFEHPSHKAVKDMDAVDDWDNFLGKDQTNIDPRDGLPDPDRIWSTDGTRSVRYGDHEMGSKPNKHHYHKETWYDDHVDNVLQRVQQTKKK